MAVNADLAPARGVAASTCFRDPASQCKGMVELAHDDTAGESGWRSGSTAEDRVADLREIVENPYIGLQNTEAEQALLGALLLNNAAFEHIVDLVRAGDFVNPVHGRLFEAIGNLITEGRKADPVVLKAIFDQDTSLAKLGGAGYLVKLVQAVVTVAAAPTYARTIADLARRREVVAAAHDVILDAAQPKTDRTAEEVIDAAEQSFYQIADTTVRQGPQSMKSIAAQVVSEIDAAYKAGGLRIIDTGLVDLDRHLNGMAGGNLIVVGGRPGMGKTMLSTTLMFNVAKLNLTRPDDPPGPGLMFSLEMSQRELIQRWIAGETGIDTQRQRRGLIESDEWPKLVEGQTYLGSIPIHIDDTPRLSVAQMRQRARRFKRRHGLGLIVVDYIQLIKQGGKQESRNVEIGDATGMLKALAKELDVPVLALSQLSRSCEQRDDKRPNLADLRESGSIEQDADVVIFIYRDEYYLLKAEPKRRAGENVSAFNDRYAEWETHCASVKGVAELIIAKNRHGPFPRVAKAHFNGPRQRFENLSRDGGFGE